MTRFRRQLRDDDSGVALVELALVLPLLAMLLFGMLDFGRALNYWLDTTHLANEGARYAAVNRNPSTTMSLQQWIKGQGTTAELRGDAPSNSVVSELQVCISFPGGKIVGEPVKVTATAQYKLFRFLGVELGSTTIKGTSVMRLEQIPTVYQAACST